MVKKQVTESESSNEQFEKTEQTDESSNNKLFDLAKNLAILIDKIDKEKNNR